MKLFKIFGAIFSVFGIAALIGAGFAVSSAKKFMRESIVANGEIVDIVTKTSRDSDGNATRSRYPVIRFQDETGKVVEFESSTSSSGGIRIGESVEVRYRPGNPKKAKSNSFGDIYGLSIVFGILGLVFSGLGVPFFWLGIRDGINEKKSQTYKMEIIAKVTGVVRNTTIQMNGRSPFQIEAQWVNPDTNEVHIFKSKNLWYDPSGFLEEKITVKADPNNLKKYWMDVSFLPKKA